MTAPSLELPTLETARLRLRPLEPADAPAVHAWVSDWDVASTTANIPHPYEPGMAEAWIETTRTNAAAGISVTLAIVERAGDTLIGSIALRVRAEHSRGEIGYWIGKAHWGQGYVTEAARAMMDYGFRALGLNRIEAHHLSRNPASGRVMVKLGMTHEGTARDHINKWGSFENVEAYSILRREWEAAT